MASYDPRKRNQFGEALRETNPGFFSRILRQLSNFGMKYDDMIIKNAVAVGINQEPTPPGQNEFYSVFSRNAVSHIMDRKSISYLDQSYTEKRRILREYSMKNTIREVIDIVADEAVIYDHQEGFVYPQPLPSSFTQEIRDRYIEVFNEIYSSFDFSNGIIPWNHFKRFLIDGYLAFEIVYDDKRRNIVGLNTLDSTTLVPAVEPESGEQIWIQFPDNPGIRRYLLDAQIIYLSYSNMTDMFETSYVEGLIRPYNQLKLIEQSKIMFNIIHASMHKQFKIPVGGLSRQMAEEQVAKVVADYKDEVSFDDTLGTVTINGSPHIPYSKEIWWPQGEGESPSMELMTPQGVDLNEDSTINWFYKQFKRASKIPLSRFDETSGGGSIFQPGGEGVTREELSFFNFISRLREIFKEIILKPFKIQMILEYPELQDDNDFLSHIDVIFNGVNMFYEWRHLSNLEKRAQILNTLSSNVLDAEGTPYFNVDFLVKRIMKLSEEDIQENKKLKIAAQKLSAAMAQAQVPGGGGAGDFGGGGFEDTDLGAGGFGDFEVEVPEVGGEETPAVETEAPEAEAPEAPAEEA